ncbi:hypothetical protein BX070DRAFT_222785 [Coemansia spiralis]|nr:hypothetical protein BX070DRAFT_222785 [Coemansia spiralis]
MKSVSLILSLGSVIASAAYTSKAHLVNDQTEHSVSLFGHLRFQWPWSKDNGKLDIPLPPSSFNPDVTVSSLGCMQAVLTLKSKFNTTCFESSKSLYFSSPGQVCSPECLDTTIKLSQYISNKCSTGSLFKAGDPVGYNHKDIVYLSWADRDMAELVCKGPTNTDTNDSHRQWDQTGQCYAAVFAAETARESNLLANGGTAEEYACNSCTKEWVKKISANKYHISPILYYGHVPDPARLATWISEQCGYNMPPIKK